MLYDVIDGVAGKVVPVMECRYISCIRSQCPVALLLDETP